MSSTPMLQVPTGSFTQGDQTVINPSGTPAAPAPGQQSRQQDMMQQLLKTVLAAAQSKGSPTLAQTGTPAPVPQPAGRPAAPSPYNHVATGLYGISSAAQNAWSMYKQKQLATAESDWSDLSTSIQKYIGPDGKVDPKAYQDPAVMQVLGDPKKLKAMSKALNNDWMNPEKTDVYSEALKSHLTKQQQKQQAAQGLRGLFSKLIRQRQQPQMNPQQQQQMASQVMAKAPIAAGGTADPEKMMQGTSDIMKSFADLTRAQNEGRDKYQFIVGGDGRIVAADKSDPTKSITLKDENGKPLQGPEKTNASVGKPVMVNQVPIGIGGIRDGKFVVKQPGDPDWTGEDAKTFSASTAATAASNQQKDHRIQLAANSRVSSYLASRMYPVQDANGNETYASGAQLSSNPTAYSPLSGAVKVQSQQAVFQDLHYTTQQMKDAVTGLGDQVFDPKARAQFLLAMRSNDPHAAFQQFLSSEAAGSLTDAQVNYVTAIAAAKESAMMLRTIGGMGSGSDMLREAVDRLVPGPGTPSAAYAKRQIDLFEGQINRLGKAVPSTATSRNAAGGGSAPPANLLKEGTVTTFKNGQKWTLQGGKPTQVQ